MTYYIEQWRPETSPPTDSRFVRYKEYGQMKRDIEFHKGRNSITVAYFRIKLKPHA